MTAIDQKVFTPLVSEKLNKKIIKAMKKGFKCYSLRRGVKEVNKAIRKDEKGIVLIAKNVSPLDLVSHLPLWCEEKDIPYVFVEDKNELASASQSKQPVVACMLTKKGRKPSDAKASSEYKEILDLVEVEVSKI